MRRPLDAANSEVSCPDGAKDPFLTKDTSLESWADSILQFVGCGRIKPHGLHDIVRHTIFIVDHFQAALIVLILDGIGELSQVQKKLSRLQEAYLEDLVSLEELRSTKNKLQVQRASLRERLAKIEGRLNGIRLEPVGHFLKCCKQTSFVAQGDDHEAKRDFYRKIGSNRIMKDGELYFEPRGAWNVVATSGLLTKPPRRRVSVKGR